MNKKEIDLFIKKIHDYTVDFANKNPNQIDLTKLDEIDEALRKKLYDINVLF